MHRAEQRGNNINAMAASAFLARYKICDRRSSKYNNSSNTTAASNAAAATVQQLMQQRSNS